MRELLPASTTQFSRTAGLLAIAVLGVILATRFDTVLATELETLHVGADVRSVLRAESAKLTLADLDRVPPELRASVKHALGIAYVSGFGALSAWLFVEGKSSRSGA